MVIETSELTGRALDWAVSKSLGHSQELDMSSHGAVWEGWWESTPKPDDCYHILPYYSKSWPSAGPIIEREGISIRKEPNGWYAFKNFSTATETPFTHCSAFDAGGETAVEAAMRCYVQSKLGEEVDVPNELIGG